VIKHFTQATSMTPDPLTLYLPFHMEEAVLELFGVRRI